MNILEFQNVSKKFFTQRLYENVELEVNSGDKIALRGNNGSGKSTLIKLITEEIYPDKGRVVVEEEARIACFDQFSRIDLDMIVEDLLNLPFAEVIASQQDLDKVSAQFTDTDADMDALMERYSEINDRFESLGGYSYMHIKEEFIEVFGLGDKLQRKFRELSGGEKQYIRLATTLFSNSDLIILDEPLSFFDIKKTKWLTDYINNSPKAFMVISHNVDFIRSFATRVFDVDNFTVTPYDCDYSSFLKEKKARIKEDKKHNLKTDLVIEETMARVEKKMKLIERVDNKHAHAVMLRRMERELEKLEKDKVEFSKEYKYEYLAAPKDFFNYKNEIADEIVSISNITKEYPEKFLFKEASLDILGDTKMVVVGKNGAGKSTLLKILAGLEEPTSGEVFRNERAKVAYIEQETVFEDEKMFIKDYIMDKTGLNEEFTEAAIDSLYNYEEEFKAKKIFMLSGGEKKRLEIFTHILADTHLLIIDEPSTYMDDYSRDTIAKMLMDYPGAVVLVTHDKALLRKIDFTLYDIRDNRFRLKQTG